MSKNPEELKKILSYKITQGTTSTKEGNKFTGCAAEVHSIENLIVCYKQLRYRFPEASHVMCAYRILDPDIAHTQDAVNHGKHGVGRQLLNLLVDGQHDNKAVFVVRYHSGTNIGPYRFKLINKVAEAALNKIPEDLESQLIREARYKTFPCTVRLLHKSLFRSLKSSKCKGRELVQLLKKSQHTMS